MNSAANLVHVESEPENSRPAAFPVNSLLFTVNCVAIAFPPVFMRV